MIHATCKAGLLTALQQCGQLLRAKEGFKPCASTPARDLSHTGACARDRAARQVLCSCKRATYVFKLSCGQGEMRNVS